MPAGDWNDPGTKQGIYMIGPDAEYLEGAHAASGSAERLVERLERALERWGKLKEEKKYANESVPAGEAIAPPDVDAAPLALRISFRDLPRGKGDRSGRRRTKKDLKGRSWMAFTEWAWNQNWLTIEEPALLVTDSRDPVAVPAAVADAIVRRALVDNVRGQNPAWRPEDVQEATLQMRAVDVTPETIEVEYTGAARMQAGEKRYAPTLFGRAIWDRKAEAFRSLQIVAIGERAGAATFNQRGEDKAPSPMGVLLELHGCSNESGE
ncbi:hypothetical protein Poly30_49710 [Planctomycetes bacterium Poly30]|uniref:Uncharacterized protein n=1 Tax=Saltatorellus ferox TaxID=2528018 RepID=A0A518EZ85_9BACT|nr:hypothetical protein Poly30_49710 [Planctomycetes bacterium Poly30]